VSAGDASMVGVHCPVLGRLPNSARREGGRGDLAFGGASESTYERRMLDAQASGSHGLEY
jgi:hypothetical protein